MDSEIAQLSNALDQITTQPSASTIKLLVPFPVFRGDESEDVHEFISNYKRAARINGWNPANLSLGLPLYLWVIQVLGLRL